jgi:mannose-6-phosphate isomerase-like protein (cupin superfamily)
MILNIVEEALNNTYYRRVVHTGGLSQLVVMALPPCAEIGTEMHLAVEQSIFIVSGFGIVIFDGVKTIVCAGDVIVIAPRTRHNLRAGTQGLKLFTIYVPPNHIDGTAHRTRADAATDIEDLMFGREVERRQEAR